MRRTRIAAVVAACAVAAAGTGVAVATTRNDDAKERESAVLTDAAKRLDVQPSELRDALAAAQDDQLDADVKAGRLTQEQADAIKARRKAEGTVLGGPGPGGPGGPGFFRHRGPGGPGFGGGPGDVLKAAAGAIGITERKLVEQLRDGKTPAEVAEANGKTVADVEAAVKAAVKKRFDAAVKSGKLTQAQADEMLDHLVDHLGDLRFGGPGGRHHGPDRPGAPVPVPPVP